jgi:hypothetical protein
VQEWAYRIVEDGHHNLAIDSDLAESVTHFESMGGVIDVHESTPAHAKAGTELIGMILRVCEEMSFVLTTVTDVGTDDEHHTIRIWWISGEEAKALTAEEAEDSFEILSNAHQVNYSFHDAWPLNFKELMATVPFTD